MVIRNRWLIPVAVVGTVATILAAGLFWLVLTKPVAAAQAFASAF